MEPNPESMRRRVDSTARMERSSHHVALHRIASHRTASHRIAAWWGPPSLPRRWTFIRSIGSHVRDTLVAHRPVGQIRVIPCDPSLTPPFSGQVVANSAIDKPAPQTARVRRTQERNSVSVLRDSLDILSRSLRADVRWSEQSTGGDRGLGGSSGLCYAVAGSLGAVPLINRKSI